MNASRGACVTDSTGSISSSVRGNVGENLNDISSSDSEGSSYSDEDESSGSNSIMLKLASQSLCVYP